MSRPFSNDYREQRIKSNENKEMMSAIRKSGKDQGKPPSGSKAREKKQILTEIRKKSAPDPEDEVQAAAREQKAAQIREMQLKSGDNAAFANTPPTLSARDESICETTDQVGSI